MPSVFYRDLEAADDLTARLELSAWTTFDAEVQPFDADTIFYLFGCSVGSVGRSVGSGVT